MKFMHFLAIAAAVTTVSFSSSALSQQRPREACNEDVKNLCSDVKPGHGQIKDCLEEHYKELSDNCYAALKKAHDRKGSSPMQQRNEGPPPMSDDPNDGPPPPPIGGHDIMPPPNGNDGPPPPPSSEQQGNSGLAHGNRGTALPPPENFGAPVAPNGENSGPPVGDGQ